MERKSGWLRITDDERKRVFSYAEELKKWLSEVKIAREAADWAIEEARKRGFKSLSEAGKGDRRVFARVGNTVVLMNFEGELDSGVNLLVAHSDSPHLDLKKVPLREDKDASIAYLKLHYYGGVKKYQWVAVPLALHGVVYTKDGREVKIVIGEREDEPVFYIPDVPPHAAAKQYERKAKETVQAEELNAICGNIPEEKEKSVKKAILALLKEKYGIEEEDLVSAELALVPAYKARDAGFDRSMIVAPGLDDRVCAYAVLRAFFDAEELARPAICIVCDREEIGSTGIGGMDTELIPFLITDAIERCLGKSASEVRRALMRSHAISADITVGLEPTWGSMIADKETAARLGYGVGLYDTTGRGGKFHGLEPPPEFVAAIRRLWDEKGVIWQPASLGKVDIAGGGTVSIFVARYLIKVLDAGPPVVSLHAPLELCSKLDAYMAYKGYRAFLESFVKER